MQKVPKCIIIAVWQAKATDWIDDDGGGLTKTIIDCMVK